MIWKLALKINITLMMVLLANGCFFNEYEEDATYLCNANYTSYVAHVEGAHYAMPGEEIQLELRVISTKPCSSFERFNDKEVKGKTYLNRC